MRRGPLVVARLVATVLGVLLVAAGVAALLWSVDVLDEIVPGVPPTLDTAPVEQVTDQVWWPWALGLLGLLLAGLALWWITALVPRPAVRTLDLPGSGPEGRLSVDAGEASQAVAESLQARLRGSSAQGHVRHEHGRLVVENRVTMDADTSLEEACAGATRASMLAREAFGRDDLLYRAVIGLPSAGRRVGRVH